MNIDFLLGFEHIKYVILTIFRHKKECIENGYFLDTLIFNNIF
jgi:hypothetical protein